MIYTLKPWRTLTAALAVAVLAAIPLVASRAQNAADAWTAPARQARQKNPIASDDKSIAAGKVIYEKECLSCHGKTGRGDGPAAKDLEKNPGDLSKPVMWDQTDGALFWKLSNGRKPMPSFDKKLSEEQLWQVINYIRTLAAKPATSPASGPSTNPGGNP